MPHISELSTFERSWREIGAIALFESSRSKLPVSSEWIAGALSSWIKLGTSNIEVPSWLKYHSCVAVPRRDRDVYCPSKLGLHIEEPSRGAGSCIIEQILSLLLHKRFRKGRRAFVERHSAVFRHLINAAAQEQRPVEIVLPALPFKCQNPLTTGHSVGFVDLGETLLFAQLRNLVASIENVYEPGARIVILCDGAVYADIFADNMREEVAKYFSRSWRIKEAFGLRNKVELVDMSWVIRHEPLFSKTRTVVTHELTKGEEMHPMIRYYMDALTRGVLFNIPIHGYDCAAFAQLLCCPAGEFPEWVMRAAHAAAVKYASFLLTMQWLEVIPRVFTQAIRGTVHPKNAPQLPLNLMRRSCIAPHNGVPVVYTRKVRSGATLQDACRIMRLCNVLTLPDLHAVFVPGLNEPFCYETG